MKVLERDKPYFAPRNVNTLNVMGMNGAYITGTTVDVLNIDVELLIEGNSRDDLKAKAEELAGWLVTEEEKPLIFDDMPNRTYYAIVEGEIDVEEIVTFSTVSFTFLCADPFKYGPELEAIFPSDNVSIINDGTAKADPIFQLEATASSTFAMVQNQNNDYVMVGEPYNIDEATPYKKYETVFSSDATSTTGWSIPGATEVEHPIDGTIIAENGKFKASDYGTGTSWHGPALKRSLPEPLTDFRIRAYVDFFGSSLANVLGLIEVYLLDGLGNSVMRMGLRDGDVTLRNTIGQMRLETSEGSRKLLINEHGAKIGTWNNFEGVLEFTRVGNEWTAYIAMIDAETGKHHSRRRVTWNDNEGLFSRNVAQVAFQFAQYDTRNTISSDSGINRIEVQRINQQDDGVPYIVNAGDTITFDHKQNEVLINGQYMPVNFGSEFFKLEKGVNNVLVYPNGTFNTSIKYRERFR